MLPNTNQKTGLPFGVVSGNSLTTDVLVMLLDSARDKVYDRLRADDMSALLRHLIECLPDDVPTDNTYIYEALEDVADTIVETRAEKGEYECDEPCAEIAVSHPYVNAGKEFTVSVSYLGGAPLITSLDGPTLQVARYCSPCVPNAADMDSGYGDILCHGLPMDWFSDEAWAKLMDNNEDKN